MCMLHFYYNIKCIKSKIKYFNKILIKFTKINHISMFYISTNLIEENILCLLIYGTYERNCLPIFLKYICVIYFFGNKIYNSLDHYLIFFEDIKKNKRRADYKVINTNKIYNKK